MPTECIKLAPFCAEYLCTRAQVSAWALVGSCKVIHHLAIAVRQFRQHGSFVNDLLSLCGSEGMSGLPRVYFCTFCSIRFTKRLSLNRHNSDRHIHRILCSHCGIFERPFGRNLFSRGHLELNTHRCPHFESCWPTFPSSHLTASDPDATTYASQTSSNS